MRKFLLVFFLLPAFTLLAQHKARIKVHVTYTNSYCGGARPTPEIEEKYKTPRDLSEYHLVLAGKRTHKVKTDSTGNFTATLPRDTYKIHLTRKKESLVTNYDPSCEKMLKASYGELIVSDEKEYTINLHFPCNLCQPHNKP